MARRKDPLMSDVRAIRDRMSKRLLEAERREGSCVPELRRLGRKAAGWMAREAKVGAKTSRKAQ
jgi:hypothetical protein